MPITPCHVATTKQLSGAYPFLCESGLKARGVVIGQDLLGGPFCFDPFELYDQGVISNPNMVVMGQLGKGKSSLVKTYLWRQGIFGRRCWVIDPKGEYGELAACFGVRPIYLRPGGSIRLNPLEDPYVGENDRSGTVTARRVELLAAIVSASLQRTLLPSEMTSIEMAIRDVESRHKQPVIPHVVEALLSPSYASATMLRTTVTELAEDGRQVALELRRLVTGDMFGMFDAPTTGGVSLDAPLVVLDMSAIYGSDALGILMSCAMAWLQGIVDKLSLAASGSSQIILVVDEAWAVLKNPAAARWLQSSWKLARAKGVSNIAVVHRASDLAAVGSAGAEQIELAKGLLSDSETRVIYTQPPGEVALAGELMGMTPVEEEIIRKLGRGIALWKVGQRSFLVRHLVSTTEQQFIQTDQRMGVGVRQYGTSFPASPQFIQTDQPMDIGA